MNCQKARSRRAYKLEFIWTFVSILFSTFFYRSLLSKILSENCRKFTAIFFFPSKRTHFSALTKSAFYRSYSHFVVVVLENDSLPNNKHIVLQSSHEICAVHKLTRKTNKEFNVSWMAKTDGGKGWETNEIDKHRRNKREQKKTNTKKKKPKKNGMENENIIFMVFLLLHFSLWPFIFQMRQI